MAVVDNILLSMEENIANGETVKGLVLDQLVKDKTITEAQANSFHLQYHVIIIKRAWYESWWNKVKQNQNGSEDKNTYQYQIVKF